MLRITIIGAGAVGTLYGGWLIAGGADVSFVARGRQLEALRTTGLRLLGSNGDFGAPAVRASNSIADLPKADVVLLTVKLYDLAEAAGIAAGGITDDGLVVGLQNGIIAFDMLREKFAAKQIMVGPVYSAARQTAPGVVEYSGAHHRVIIGNPSGALHPAAAQLIADWRKAGVEAEISDDIRHVLWIKYLAFATNAALTCLSRQSAGTVYHDADLLALARGSIAEIVAIGEAEGIAWPADAIDITIRLLQSFPADMVASMRQDLDAGRRLELDGITGAIVALGRRHGIPTPIHETAFACLKPYRDGAP